MPPSRFLKGFTLQTGALPDIDIHYASAGKGPPVLLLHGHPQTHIVWRRFGPQLVAAGYQVIASDLRGYGDSEKPDSDAEHLTYSKRAMARDQIALMASLGHDRFSLVGHDRGGRVAHRLALDFPDAVDRVAVLDIAPTRTMYDLTDKEFATLSISCDATSPGRSMLRAQSVRTQSPSIFVHTKTRSLFMRYVRITGRQRA